MKITNSSYGGGGCGGGNNDNNKNREIEDDLFGNPRSWPPGFRFHPTDEELVLYYLKRKICRRKLKLDVVKDLDVYKWDPEELPGQSILQSRDRQWYFFTPRDRRYPNAARSNRATRHGYWKATGKDRSITWDSRSVGVKKTLVFYKGRAPCGERTDWVMHEYTMDENELQRCKNAQDYYVLNKVFKKSGPGPKNGEQYGAPFREEDWVDDDEVVIHNTPKKGGDLVPYVTENPCGSPVEDLDEIFRQIVSEVEAQNSLVGPSFGEVMYIEPVSCGSHKKQYNTHVGDEENQSTILGPSVREAISFEPVSSNHPCQNQSEATSFEPVSSQYTHQNHSDAHTQSAAFGLTSCEAPEVTSASASNVGGWASPGEEGLNFLELDDLDGPQQFGASDVIVTGDDANFGEFNGLLGSDTFFDASMFLQDIETFNLTPITDPQNGNFACDVSNEVVCQTPTHLYGGEGGQLWMQDQRFIVSAPAESNHIVMASPTSESDAIIQARNSTNLGEENGNGDIDSWFSSAISNFLGSVPTRPAFASENVLINRAFERMSSFGKVKIVATDSGAGTGGGTVEERSRKRVSRTGGLLFFSVLVVVCAILWMVMIGTTLKVLKILLGRLISS